MARIRTIKPEFFASEQVAALSHAAKLTFVGMWCEADDYGVLSDSPKLLKGHLWPLADDITAVDVSLHLQEMVDGGLVRRFEADDRRWLWIVNFKKHQVINKPSKRRNATPPWVEVAEEPSATTTQPEMNGSGSAPVVVTEDYPKEVEVELGSGKEKEVESSGGSVDFAAVASLGIGTTTTTSLEEDSRADTALRVFASRMAADKKEPAAYKASIIRNGSEHREALQRLAAADFNASPDDLAARYIASRSAQPVQAQPPQPCGNCKSIAHRTAACPIPPMERR